ncbi:MAG: phosphatidylserine decarboxylase [Candidatus Pelagibacterales bacterium]|nr:MAG: phosphatidylserine decarboxylase [Pelagibacterales bacterium]
MLDILFPKLHKEGYRFLAISAAITFILLLISNFLGLISFVLTIWVYYFFRDPEKFPINDENYLISPADGTVSQISEINGPAELGLENKKFTRVSIFMNVFNCHVNRIPCSGKISKIFYKSGKYINASLDKASEENERNYILMNNNDGDKIVLVQIAGLIARRIVCDAKENDENKQGDRFGIIRFGSRVDLYFENYQLMVQKRQKTIGGETIIAKKK